MSKPHRNDPCPCGSGRKYKTCCLPREELARPRAVPSEEHFFIELRPEVDEAVDGALQRMEQGEWKQVESEIKQLLQRNPDYHMTNYAMGVFQAMGANNPAAALPFFERAVAIYPQFAEAHFNLAMSARQLFDIPKAVTSFRAALKYSADAGIVKMAREQLDWLEKTVCKTSPFTSLDAYVANARIFDRAFQCLTNRQFDEAATLFQRVLEENPKHVQSYGNLALAYAGLGRRSDALACFDRAFELDPDYEPAILNRRVTEQMREGEPAVADGIQQVDFYAERLRNESRSGHTGV